MAKVSLSGLRAFVAGFEGGRFFVGVDVHKRSYHVAFKRPDGETCSWVAPPNAGNLLCVIEKMGIKVSSVVYEAGPTGFGLARSFMKVGIPVIVAAPSRIPRPSSPGVKTDRLDCLRLADYASRGMLRSIAIPSEAEEARRSLTRRRHQLVDEMRRAKNRIKALLLFLGIDEPKGLRLWTRTAMEELRQLKMAQAAHFTLDSLLVELDCLEANLVIVRKQIMELVEDGESREVIRNLQSVPGVGPVVATTFRSELFTPERFTRPEEVAGYLGLAPVVRQSGEGKSKGRIRPSGQSRLKSLLVEAAWIWKAKDEWAGSLYRKLLSRTGVAQKAIIALARRLAIILWRLSIEKRAYRPGVAVMAS